MKDLKNLEKFETSLMKHLNHDGINKASLKTISAEIVNLKKNGLGIDQVEIISDGILINGQIDPDFFTKFRNLGRGFKRFEIFPYGIIDPEGFRFRSILRR